MRLTALAQLIAKYAQEGVTSTAELARLTEHSDRAIRKAKAELGCRNPGAAPGTPVPPPPEPECRVERVDSRARIESTLRVDTLCEEREEKKDSAAIAAAPPEPSASACKDFVFEGANGRVAKQTFERWRKAYPAIPNLLAELQACDDYYTDHPERLKGKWFFAFSSWLRRSNAREETDKRTAEQREMDEICPPEIYGRLQ